MPNPTRGGRDRGIRASVVIPAYGDEPLLSDCVASVLTDPTMEAIVVDNGGRPEAIDAVRGLRRTRVVQASGNLGYAGGCDLGVSLSEADLVVLLNSDAVARPGALAALVDALDDPSVGLASASVRLLDEPELMNSAGNPVHYTGIAWSGGYGLPPPADDGPVDVASASGAAMAMRRADWVRLGGTDPRFFAYGEDVDLSLRCWISGLRVVYVPASVVLHDYEFSSPMAKYYLLERNRLVTILTVLERRTLVLLALPLLTFELLMLAVAARQGWVRQKLRGWVWLVSNAGWLRSRRARVQRSRVTGDAALARVLSPVIELPPGFGIRVPPVANRASRLVWWGVRRALSPADRVRLPQRGR